MKNKRRGETLSDKIIPRLCDKQVIRAADVREFIKKIKKRIKRTCPKQADFINLTIIDEEAGEKLIK